MAEDNRSLHYFGVGAAVFVPVLAALFVYNYIETRIAVAQIEEFTEHAVQSMQKVSARTNRKLAEQRMADERRRQIQIDAVHEQRRKSTVGRELYRKCVEFMEFYKDHPGDYALQQRERACTSYGVFIETGRRRS